MADDLPSSRPALFWDILRNEYRKLLAISAVLILFAVPFLACHFLTDAWVIALEGSGSENTVFPRYIFLALNPVATLIFGLGVGGCLRIIKRLCYLEPVFFYEDLKLGIKQNGRQSAVGSFFIGLFFSGTYIFRLLRPAEFLWNIPVGLFALVVYPSFLFSFPIISTYKINTGQAFSVGARMYFKTFVFSLIPLSLFLAPYLFEMIPDLVIKYIAILLFLLLSPMWLLSFFLYETHFLDKYINKENYPELYGRGLHKKNEE